MEGLECKYSRRADKRTIPIAEELVEDLIADDEMRLCLDSVRGRIADWFFFVLVRVPLSGNRVLHLMPLEPNLHA
jgi:hypothetical protein